MNLTDHQREQIEIATSNRLGILRGSPGTGKTYCAASVIEGYGTAHGYDKIAVMGPTGKASVRVTELMQQHGIPLTARTIHSSLESKYDDAHGWQFQRNRTNPLTEWLIVVDESSMLTVSLMASLLDARSPEAKILFIGDTGQLPPIGHGAPLRDMIEAGVPCGTLTEIHRNGGAIVQACAAISRGEEIVYDGNLQISGSKYVPQTQTIIEELLALAENHGLDPIWDAQVICAVNDSGPVNRKYLNHILQNALNPLEDEYTLDYDKKKAENFRVGDKLINTENGWMSPSKRHAELPAAHRQGLLEDDKGRLYVANGDFARVLSIDKKGMELAVSSPLRYVTLRYGKAEPSEDPDSPGCKWELGYACSCHKFQGSETPLAIVVLDESPAAHKVCDRSWLYTAISRAKLHCQLVGKQSTAAAFIRNQAINRRQTFLRQRLERGLVI